MSRRNKKYASSEREAEVAIGLIFRVLIFAFGSVLALVALTNYFVGRDEEDLLEPVKKQSDLTFTFSRLPAPVKDTLSAFIILLPISVLVVYLNQTLRLGMFGYVASVIVTAVTFLCLVAAIFFFVIFKRDYPDHRAFQLHDPSRYQSLFRDGKDVFYDAEQKQNFTTYTIRIPKGTKWNDERSTRLVEQLIYSFAPLLFRIYADDRNIVWQVVDILARESEPIESAIRISYPEADVHVGLPQDLTTPAPKKFYRLTLLYRAVNEFVFPFKYTSDIKDFNPLAAVVSAMNGLQEGERVIYSIFVAGAARHAHERGQQLITKSTITPFDYFSGQGLQRIATLKSLNLDRVDKYVPEDQKVGEEKLKHPLYQSVFMIQVDSEAKERILPLAQNMDSQLYGFARAPYNGLRWYTGIKEDDEDEKRVAPDPESLILELNGAGHEFSGSIIDRIIRLTESQNEQDARKATRLILGGREIGLLWHLPDETFTASRTRWLSSRTVPPPTTVVYQEATHSVQIGNGTSGGKLFPIHLPLKDRENHVRIIGKTGVGKSTLLHDLIMQDIHNGYGVAVIDPHGSLVQSVLETPMTSEEIDRIVVLDLSDRQSPPPLNPLRGGLGQVRVGQIVQSIERIYPATGKYPRLSYYLRIALLTLNADPAATMKDVVRLFTDAVYRTGLVEQLDDAELLNAWEEFDRMKDGEKRTITEPIRTRMSPFYSNPDLTPIMCHPDTLDFRQMLQERKIILISLKMDEERVPQTERDLIGALLISRIQMAGMYDQGGTPYFVYIDEVQRFIISSLDKMFDEARKFGLSLTVAHQYLEQLPDTTQNAIIGNAGASIIFACSPKDAQVFQPYTRPAFDVDDIVNLDQFTAVVKMQCDGVSQPAFTLLTPLPQVEFPQDIENTPVFRRRLELNPDVMSTQAFKSKAFRQKHARRLREFSRESYTPMKREDVNAWLRARYGQTVKLDDQTQFFDVDTESDTVEVKPPSSVRRIDHISGGGTVTAD